MPMRWKCLHPVFKNHTFHPCGECRYCRMNETRDWAVRTCNEQRYYKYGSFVTLTYDNKKVAENPYDKDYYDKPLVWSLHYQDLKDFLGRLRDQYEYNADLILVDKTKIIGKKNPRVYPEFKYMGCGEYGDEFTHRPHWHICLLGVDFADKYPWRRSRKCRDKWLYRSPVCEKLWKYGNVEIGSLEEDDINYCSGYVQKKIKSKGDEYYRKQGKEPPKRYMSKGLGKRFLEEFFEDIKRDGFVFYKGKKTSLPRYYRDKVYSKEERQAIVEKYAKEKFIEAEKLRDKALKKYGDAFFYDRNQEELQNVRDRDFQKKYQDRKRNLDERN